MGGGRPGPVATAHGRMAHAGIGTVRCNADAGMDVQKHEASISASMVWRRVQVLLVYVDLTPLVGNMDPARNSIA